MERRALETQGLAVSAIALEMEGARGAAAGTRCAEAGAKAVHL
jgi:hypothetical protein